MLDLKEAEEEYAEHLKSEQGKDNWNKVIKSLPKFNGLLKPKDEKLQLDAMFTGLEHDKDQGHQETNDPNSEDDEEEFKELTPQRHTKIKNKLDEDLYPDPPMPFMGRPIKFENLKNRNIHAEEGMKSLMELVKFEVDSAVNRADTIPVPKSIDRLSVTKEAADNMAKVRSKRGIEKRVANNMTEIQKTLNFRKSAISMMNVNYSDKLVRKIEPIYTNEARTIISYK